MEHKTFLILFICGAVFPSSVFGDDSFVVLTTESAKGQSSENDTQINPEIYSMHVNSNVSNRFARTLITSKVRNLKSKAAETTFSVILPENAFISEFEMEIEGKIYKAYVKEKEEAKQIYQQAVARGRSAAHVELSARDSKTFTVSVNIEPESKTIFRLVYEELLERRTGQYELVINIHPGQVVKDLGVEVHVNESRPLTFVKTPSLRTGNEISKNSDKLDPSAEIDIVNSTSATVRFNPDISHQKKFAELLGSNKENGLAGQFVVQYDVERDPQGGEVLVRDGYFVHFFAPSDLEPLPKHVVFVLDHSGSMSGRKFEQLVTAMQNILSELKTEDLFNIVRFSDNVFIYNVTEDKFSSVGIGYSSKYGHLEPDLRELNLPDAVEANEGNVDKAKNIVKNNDGMGSTNIIGGLEVGLFLTKRTQEKVPNKYQPMIIFLTDGYANVGITGADEITSTVAKLNSGNTNPTPIFSLSFGTGADKSFLRKLSAHNLGFSKHIYESSDASLQLEDFYQTISSPLLSNVTFKYVDGVTAVTKTHHPILFRGSELVVAGRTSDSSDVLPNVIAICTTGPRLFNATRTEPVTALERLWAYLTVKQILIEREVADDKTELTKKALDLALKYSFVTSVSSLVVVKPNETDSVNTNTASNKASSSSMSRGASGYSYNRAFHPASRIAASPGYPGLMGPVPRSSYAIRLGGGPVSYRPWHPSTTRRVPLLASSTTSSPSNTRIPQWLETLKANNENITTPQGTFKLGQSGDVTTHPDCPRTPLNGTGICTIIFDCPQVYSALTDVNVYLQYFCPLNEYAGVCCPKSLSAP